MNKIKDILYYCEKIIDKGHLINVLDDLTNMERNIVFNKLYNSNYYNYDECYDRTLLQYIYTRCFNGKEIAIDLLKKYKDNININAKNKCGYMLLFYVIYNKDIETFKLIYELYKDINVNILDNNGNNILYNIMPSFTYEEIIRLLLEKNIRIQYKLLIHIINNNNIYKIYISNIMDILLEYLHKNDNDNYYYILEELYKYVIENVKINEDNKDFYDKIFAIKSNMKSAAKILAPV